MVRVAALASMAAAMCCSFAEAQFTFPSNTCPDGASGQTQVSGASGTITYPAGSGNYLDDQTPCWYVECDGTLTFTWSTFRTENNYDFVSMWPVASDSSVDTSATAVFRESGVKTLDPTVFNGGGGALMQFKSDGSVQEQGFSVGYQCVSMPPPPTPPTPPTCTDVMIGSPPRAWYDSDGSTYTCAWYGAVSTRCSQHGDSFEADGYTANRACCTCGGGDTSSPPPTPPTPPATCTSRVRKEWRQLSTAEKALFMKAVQLLKTTTAGSATQSAKGGYDKYPTIHGKDSSYLQAHGTGMFLPWHRVFIQKFEDDLRALGAEFACVTLPYWDWSIEEAAGAAWDPALWNSNTDPASGEFIGFGSVYNGRSKADKCNGPVDGTGGYHSDGCCVSDGPFRKGAWVHSHETSGSLPVGDKGDWPLDNKCLFRYFANDNLVRSTATQAADFLPQATYGYDTNTNPGFRNVLEDKEHSEIHARIGGYMITNWSPEDPIFFLHHANIDRLWAMWQVCQGHDSAAGNVKYDAGPPVAGTSTGLNDEMSYHNFYDRTGGATTDPQPAQWSGFTPAKVWDLHHADLYAHSGPTGPKVQYEINDFNGGSAWTSACPNVDATGQANWFVARPPTVSSLLGGK